MVFIDFVSCANIVYRWYVDFIGLRNFNGVQLYIYMEVDMKVAFSFVFSLYCMVAAQDVPDSINGSASKDSLLEAKLDNLEFVTEPYRTADSSAIPIVQYHMLDDSPRILKYPKDVGIRNLDREYNLVVKMLIASDGSVIESKIVRSSGNAELDSTMLDAVLDYKFTPPKHDGKPVRVWVAMPISFVLQ